jgi:drug/metabolite transporter (DMT)-like permease
LPLTYFLLHEKITMIQLIALSFILSGVVIAEKRFKRK